MNKPKFVLLTTLALFLTACGQPSAMSRGTSQNGSNDDHNCVNNTCFTATAKSVESVVTQRQLLPNYTRCLGLTEAQVSAATKTAFTESQTSFSQEGAVKDVSAPLLMSVTKVAGEICRDLIVVERGLASGRKFFPGYALGGAASTETYSFETTIRNFAAACWGRAATAEEVTLLSDSFATKTRNSAEALFMCTAALSSVQAIRF